MALEKAIFKQQCTAPDGSMGSFLVDINRDKLLSPVFADTLDLIRWCQQNGWKSGGTLTAPYVHESGDVQ